MFEFSKKIDLLLVPIIVLAGTVLTWGVIKEKERLEFDNRVVEMERKLEECERKLAIPKICNCKQPHVESIAVWKELAERCVAKKLRVRSK